jgi:tripartite-type tricarboxylate transporter receptor subunit TctC
MPRLLVFALLLFHAAAHAQAWPVKPVRLVVANAAGAVVDTGLRIIANNLSGVIGQAVAVDNRPGGDGVIAAEVVARASPDGHTLMFASQSFFSIDPHLKKSLPLDPDRDFTPIAMLVDDSGATGLFAHPSMPFSTLTEMVAFAKQNPGKLSVATTTPHFAMLATWLDKRAGMKTVVVPYKAAPQAIQDLLAGRVELFLTNYGFFERYVKEGKARPLAVTRATDEAPGVPTIASVFPGFTYTSFFSLMGPAGMPRDLVLRINRAAAQVVENPGFNQDLRKVRWRNTVGALTPEGAAEAMRQARNDWGVFIREIGLQPQ